MPTLKFDSSALLTLILFVPCLALAAENLPSSGPDIDRSSQVAHTEPATVTPQQSTDTIRVVATTPANSPAPSRQMPAEDVSGIGAAIALEKLEAYRGGSEVSNTNLTNGLVQDTTAINVATGRNSITDGAFANSSGLPIVIQNSGANVLIQNSTIINVQFK